MIVGDAKAIQAIDPVQLKDMLLHGAFDQDANGGSSLQVKQLSSQAFDEDGKQIVTAIAITKPTYDLPTAAVKVSFKYFPLPAVRRISSMLYFGVIMFRGYCPFVACRPQ